MDEITLIIALLVAALVLFGLEIVTPTLGILAVVGIAALAGAAWLGFTVNSVLGLVIVIASLVLVPVYLVFLVRWLPKSPLGKRLFLQRQPPEDAHPGFDEQAASVVGKTGTAETTLRPTGAVRVEGKRLIASAESGMIAGGAKVKVIRASGMNLIVREVKD